MHQQPAPSTFPVMPAPNMLGSRYAMMMMPGRIPDHVFGGTVFLASPTGPLPHKEPRFSSNAVKRDQVGSSQREGVPGYPTKKGRKTSILRN